MKAQTRRAVSSPDFYPLTYADPTGESAVRNLQGGDYTITGPDGFRLWIRLEDLAPLLHNYNYRVSRKGLWWATRKKKAPDGLQTDERQKLNPPTAK